MEFCRGRDLASALEQLSKRFVLGLKVVHRKLSTNNIFVCWTADDLALDLDHSAKGERNGSVRTKDAHTETEKEEKHSLSLAIRRYSFLHAPRTWEDLLAFDLAFCAGSAPA